MLESDSRWPLWAVISTPSSRQNQTAPCHLKSSVHAVYSTMHRVAIGSPTVINTAFRAKPSPRFLRSRSVVTTTLFISSSFSLNILHYFYFSFFVTLFLSPYNPHLSYHHHHHHLDRFWLISCFSFLLGFSCFFFSSKCVSFSPICFILYLLFIKQNSKLFIGLRNDKNVFFSFFLHFVFCFYSMFSLTDIFSSDFFFLTFYVFQSDYSFVLLSLFIEVF